MIDTFLFDMGNVLLHFSHPLMCAQIAAVCGTSPEEIRRLLFDLKWENEFERGELTEAQFQARLENHFQRAISLPDLARAASDIFTLNAPMIPILQSLRRQGKRLVLLSNTSISHIEFIRREFDVLDYFDDCVLSYEVGAMKPQPEIFQAALQKIHCEPDRCFYTDDIADYIAAAGHYGLQADLFTTAESLAVQLARRGVQII